MKTKQKVQIPELTNYVVELCRRGYSNSGMCDILGISIFTLWNHLKLARTSSRYPVQNPLSDKQLFKMMRDVELLKASYVSAPNKIKEIRLSLNNAKKAAANKAIAKFLGSY